ncbi:hypothetical protein ACLOJK_029483 [Asimina triloba]
MKAGVVDKLKSKGSCLMSNFVTLEERVIICQEYEISAKLKLIFVGENDIIHDYKLSYSYINELMLKAGVDLPIEEEIVDTLMKFGVTPA